MGCDIHVCTETFKYSRGEKKWVNSDNWRLNEYYGGEEDAQEYDLKPIYNDRNYLLFSLLADVRNYGGNKSFEFDSGVPDDVSDKTLSEYERWGDDAHTPGWATLKELKEAKAQTPKVKRKGFVIKKEADKYREDGTQPTEWCQGVYGPHAVNFEWLEWEDDNDEFDTLIDAMIERKMDIFWQRDKSSTEHDEDIRIVFWFDN